MDDLGGPHHVGSLNDVCVLQNMPHLHNGMDWSNHHGRLCQRSALWQLRHSFMEDELSLRHYNGQLIDVLVKIRVLQLLASNMIVALSIDQCDRYGLIFRGWHVPVRASRTDEPIRRLCWQVFEASLGKTAGYECAEEEQLC